MGPIARLTFQEVIHKRIFYIVLAMTAAFLALYSLGLGFTYKQMGLEQGLSPEKIVFQGAQAAQLFGVGLYFSSFILALLSIMASIGSISTEVENGIIYSILAKPLSRREVVLGKFTGYALLLSLYGMMLFFAVYGVNYAMLPGNLLALELPYLALALLLYILPALILLALGLFLSTRFDALNAGIIAIILYGIGLVGGFLEQIGVTISNTGLVNTGIVASLIMPVDAVNRKMQSIFLLHNKLPIAFTGPGMFGASTQPSGVMVLYGLLFTVVFLLLAVHSFGRRDL